MRAHDLLGATIVCLVFAPISEARTAFPVEAKLVVPYTKILPGMPFEMWVDVHNPSEFTVHLAVCGPLQIRMLDGQLNFECGSECRKWMERRHRSERSAEAVLAPGERKSIALPVHLTLSGAAIVDDIVLSKAVGRTLSIAIQLCLVDWPASTSKPPWLELPPKLGAPLITNEVEIEVTTATGSDAKVWERMLASGDGEWVASKASEGQSRKLWNEVLSEYPDSNYVPYAVLATFESPSPTELDRVLDTIRRFPDSPVVELLHVRAWRTAQAVGNAAVAKAEGAIVAKSTRPTTRSVVCPPENGCVDPWPQ